MKSTPGVPKTALRAFGKSMASDPPKFRFRRLRMFPELTSPVELSKSDEAARSARCDRIKSDQRIVLAMLTFGRRLKVGFHLKRKNAFLKNVPPHLGGIERVTVKKKKIAPVGHIWGLVKTLYYRTSFRTIVV
jgi:hypothetical protein